MNSRCLALLMMMAPVSSSLSVFSMAVTDRPRKANTRRQRKMQTNTTTTSMPTDCSADSSLSSGFNDTRNTEYQGIMFDVYVPLNATNEDIHIIAFDLNLDGQEKHEVQVYSRLGTHVENEDSSEGWSNLGTYEVDGQGEGQGSHLKLNGTVLVKPGEVMAFYLAQTNNDEFRLHDRRREGVGAVLASNGALEILVGTAKEEESDPFEDDNREGMGFSGTIHYHQCGLSSPRPTPIPTRSPTAQPTIYSEEQAKLSTNFQLKMFWEEGMEWQESSDEKAWCAERKSSDLEIKECDDDDKKQRWYYFEGQIKSLDDDDECMRYSTKTVSIERCDGGEDQQWVGFRARTGGKFQLKPKGDQTKCLTQQHHPRSGEELFVYDCEVAEHNDEGKYDDTSHWVIGKWDGHL